MRQHENCKICEEHPKFDLDSKVYVHGEYVTKEQILKNQEDAEKLIEFQCKFNDCKSLKHQMKLQLDEYKETVERLKERIKECETNSLKISMADNWEEYKNQIRLLPELQKILEGKK